MRTILALAAASALFAGGAQAHVVMSPNEAAPGSTYVGALRVTHGCSGAATLTLRVELPAGMVSAKPQPKAGWTVRIEREPLAAPVPGEGGRMVRDRVKAIVWQGRLPDDQFDDFGLMLKLPAAPGPLYLPAVQTCEDVEVRWTDIPAPGQAWHDVAHPAPVITLAPAPSPAAEHHH